MTLRYKLRTLLLLLAVLPPLLWLGWLKYEVWRAEQARGDARQLALTQLTISQARLAALQAKWAAAEQAKRGRGSRRYKRSAAKASPIRAACKSNASAPRGRQRASAASQSAGEGGGVGRETGLSSNRRIRDDAETTSCEVPLAQPNGRVISPAT